MLNLNTMELKDFVGERLLSGIDVTHEDVKDHWGDTESVQVVLFIIDGITYKAQEDPDDGYRSYLSGVEVTDQRVKNVFTPCAVIGKMKERDEYGDENNTIQFYDAITNRIVLEIGTDNCDDYYPYCVLNWNPENLSVNAGV